MYGEVKSRCERMAGARVLNLLKSPDSRDILLVTDAGVFGFHAEGD